MEPEVTIIEIGPREGLQSHLKFIETESKVALINRLFDAGFRKIEVTSFVHPKTIPQMKDAVEVLRGINKKSENICQVLVPNETGCRNAVACNADEIVVWIFLTDELNYRTQNRSRAETLKEIDAIIEIAQAHTIKVSAYIGGAFGYPGMDSHLYRDVKGLVAKLMQLGCYEVCLNDEFCIANPNLIKKHLRIYLNEMESSKLAVHFHDNKGLGLVNILAAYQEGIRTFKSVIGGVGVHRDLQKIYRNGVVNKKQSTNIPTEYLVYFFEEMGIPTGIDVNKLIECRLFAEKLFEIKFNSYIFNNYPSKEQLKYINKLI
jgi:hydroxymethylglutaryl-CoA lyase